MLQMCLPKSLLKSVQKLTVRYMNHLNVYRVLRYDTIISPLLKTIKTDDTTKGCNFEIRGFEVRYYVLQLVIVKELTCADDLFLSLSERCQKKKKDLSLQ